MNRSQSARLAARARWGRLDEPEEEPCDCDTCVRSGCNDPDAASRPPHRYGPMMFRPYRHWHQDHRGPGPGGAHIIVIDEEDE